MARLDVGDTHAGPDVHPGVNELHRSADGVDEGIPSKVVGAGIGTRGEEEEFVAAEASGPKTVRGRDGAESLADLFESRVAVLVAPGVVHGLETVKVDDGDGDVVFRAVELSMELVRDRRPARKTGERVPGRSAVCLLCTSPSPRDS